MPFNETDIYTSSGSVKLHNSWTPYVSKYDTSSFYNWEQDNLPLYDLEERTYELWEQAGFPTSAIPGFALTVSADTPLATLAADSTIFTDLSSCIAAIPKVVRFPILVEVGNFGDLGDLELHNFRIEEGGSIEIINRGFGQVYNASSDVRAIHGTNSFENATHTSVFSLSSFDLSSSVSSTSCVHIGSTVLSGAGDARLTSINGVLYPQHGLRAGPLGVQIDKSFFIETGPEEGPDTFRFEPFERTAFDLATDKTLPLLDISATNQKTGATLVRNSTQVDGKVGGSYYFNNLSKISVKNCDGPIYIRDFFVDGKSATNSGKPIGIEITNSDVVLESCASVRAREAGFKFNNSKVVLSRTAFAYRNYGLDSTTTRSSTLGIGFHAVNSEVIVSALIESSNETGAGYFDASGDDVLVIAARNDIGFQLDNSKLVGGVTRTTPTNNQTGSMISSEFNTNYGIKLINSEIDSNGLLDLYGNAVGVHSDLSKVTFEYLCVDGHSSEGIIAEKSTFVFDSPSSPEAAGQVDRKQLDMSSNSQHLDLRNNSSFSFARKNNIPTLYGNCKFDESHGVITWNGAAKATLPAISVDGGSVLDLVHADIRARLANNSITDVPAYGQGIRAVNNSKVSLFGTGNGCTFVYGPVGLSYQQKVAGLYAGNSSEINLHGPTAIAQFGIDVLVENNSTLNITPPTSRSSFGLEVSAFELENQEHHTSVELHATRACLVAAKNSVINMRDLGAYSLNWPRTPQGEVALGLGTDYPLETFDTSSYIFGGALQFYPNPQDSIAVTQNNLDDLVTGLGWTAPGTPTFTQSNGLNQFFIVDDPIAGTTSWTNRAKLTQGGVCVRAVENSVVNVTNVHFPIGTNNSPLDGKHYTTSGSDCDKFMIWNLADNSRLNASFTSVSGMHPVSNQYHGPSSFWASSVDGVNQGEEYDAPAYGAPAGTPDTGSLSVLDVFGAGSSVLVIPSGVDVNTPFDRFYPISGIVNDETASALSQAGINVSGNDTLHYGAPTHTSNNRGPFRIYWSPKASAKFLQTDLSAYLGGAFGPTGHGGNFSGVVGPAYQMFAQGYNCMSPLSALVYAGEVNASSIVPDLLKLSKDSTGDGVMDSLWTSGFYYCSEMLEENPSQCMVDESAGNTFANSKNASVGGSGRPKKVTYYRARSDTNTNREAESFTGDVSGALGFKSASIFDLERDN